MMKTCGMMRSVILLAVALAGVHGRAASYINPVIEGNLADPSVVLHEGVYYLYATGEVNGDNGTRVYTSTNLVDWKRGPVVFRPGDPHVWAPDVWRDPDTGHWYLYYTVNQTVGVAEGEGPLGPFTITRKFFDHAIDAHLFRDDDGRLYLYFVQLPGFRITVQPMANPTTLKGESREILHPESPWETRAGHVTEGPWIIKRDGIYYLLYSGSGANTPQYGVGYATADNPMGPFTRAPHNPIVHRSDVVFGPGHGCAIRDGDGRWWHVYHQKRNDRVEWDRFICIDPFWFNEDGRLFSRATRGTPQPAPAPISRKAAAALGREYHVSPDGDDGQEGSADRPLRTISAAAERAQPGDTITVHEGVYHERIAPPRGGRSDAERIVYQAAPGESVVLKGSEPVKGWEPVDNDTWKVTLPNSFFGDFNPYSDEIHGDWFNPKGRKHHTGAVYLNGHWLTEAARLEDVLKPVGAATSSSNGEGSGEYLLNVAWLRPAGGSRVAAADFAEQQGVQKAACSEGGECIGWIEEGNWARYSVDFGQGVQMVEIRAASATAGGLIELRLGGPAGDLIGVCKVPNTGDWQSWSSFRTAIKPTRGEKTLYTVFRKPRTDDSGNRLWFARVDESRTTIWAQFKDVNPNEADVEINVRQTVFYPDKPGVNYLTVRGFTMRYAASPWAPPTAEQIGLLGTHWSKGWIIEDNDIAYSTCVGITLGKHGDQYDNTSQNTAEGYVKTIERGLENGWSRKNIGSHIVRNNHISHCEQAGIVGSLGPIFCTVTGNVIHDIHVRRLFTGAEMAGIKFHAAIDTEIRGNHIYRTTRGIWLDWMAQGTRVTQNLLHDNGPSEDLFMEVNHGPFMIDNNIFLSPTSLLDVSQGGAYVHNLFAGRVVVHPELNRETPYHPAHTTKVAGLHKIEGGDNRFYNNVFVGANGLAPYDNAARPVFMAGNVFLKGARPSRHEENPLVLSDYDPELSLVHDDAGARLHILLDDAWAKQQGRLIVTTDLLGRAAVPELPYVQPDGGKYRIDRDYFGRGRHGRAVYPGPFAGSSEPTWTVWSR